MVGLGERSDQLPSSCGEMDSSKAGSARIFVVDIGWGSLVAARWIRAGQVPRSSLELIAVLGAHPLTSSLTSRRGTFRDRTVSRHRAILSSSRFNQTAHGDIGLVLACFPGGDFTGVLTQPHIPAGLTFCPRASVRTPAAAAKTSAAWDGHRWPSCSALRSESRKTLANSSFSGKRWR